ncbi:MAG: [FeFe] hydrogenase H-cluster radical SAM maturase HydE [Planctomycetota bacterium]|nr:[FeFe] hydrogenase H-cluster radical SAM maturase HydE [Planctomycetota bacterium]
MDKADILSWLRETDKTRLKELWRVADQTRRKQVGDAVHLRGLIEISNNCVRECGYCGLRAGHKTLRRYRMSADEILECAHKAVAFGYGTVVMQAGEDYGITGPWLADVVRRIKAETPLAVTLSMGERPEADLVAWRKAGADRYLLRFETSDEELYRLIHPALPGRPSDRIALLRSLRTLGYEVGSGVMIGIPGQTYDSLAADIDLFRTLDLDMIGVGPYISHPATPLGSREWKREVPAGQQVPNTELMVYKVVALARLVCPEANIPSTTALATINKATGRELGLMRGANVVMPNLTPVEYRALYEIYPAKACIFEDALTCHGCLKARIVSLGREVGVGPGGRHGSKTGTSLDPNAKM